VDAGSVVAEVLESLVALITEVDGAIVATSLPSVAIHRGALAQVFQNLISNSIKYRSAEAPRIDISAESGDGWSVFSVADNGLGIEREFSEQIFGMFQRAHGREYPGSGIGLAICRRLVERYGGRIWLEKSVPGSGATFCFSVPSGTSESGTGITR
jgi:light-regulated signal transduction histidine kinase (bacteriophytochrome)